MTKEEQAKHKKNGFGGVPPTKRETSVEEMSGFPADATIDAAPLQTSAASEEPAK